MKREVGLYTNTLPVAPGRGHPERRLLRFSENATGTALQLSVSAQLFRSRAGLALGAATSSSGRRGQNRRRRHSQASRNREEEARDQDAISHRSHPDFDAAVAHVICRCTPQATRTNAAFG